MPAARLGQQRTALLDVVAYLRTLHGIPFRKAVPLHIQQRGGQPVFERRVEIHDLPCGRLTQLVANKRDEVCGVVGVGVPGLLIGPLELLVQQRLVALGKEEDSKGGVHDAVAPRTGQTLRADQVCGPFAVPIVVAKRSSPGEDPATFDGIEPIVHPTASALRVLVGAEVAPQPVQPVE